MVSRTKLIQTLFQFAKNLKTSIFLIPLSLIPLGWVVVVLEKENSHLKSAAQHIEILQRKAQTLQQKQTREEVVWKQVEKSDPLYLSQAVESIPLLVSELQRVQVLAKQYPEKRPLHERLAFLQSGQNQIRFVEKTQRKGPYFQETELKLQNPVQMNDEDLRKFLNSIEGKDPFKPLLIVKNFELKKKKEKGDEMIYNIQLELIKRMP